MSSTTSQQILRQDNIDDLFSQMAGETAAPVTGPADEDFYPQMWRTVTRDGRCADMGPWHTRESDAKAFSKIFKTIGYSTSIEVLLYSKKYGWKVERDKS